MSSFLVLFVLAYIVGIAFQYLPLRAMRRISRREALIGAINADTLALTPFEIGLFAWMAFAYFQFVPRSGLTSPTYWFMMQIGMGLGFIASFPMNWYLVRANVKHGIWVSPLSCSCAIATITVAAVDSRVPPQALGAALIPERG